ncbi:hypothetical protein IO99_04915 [Clostridium sulfidigenes]|uniref:Uncharacterized protein n=1 Tax=Clostridium sulfidigenes TaxID=318464 RepID=A0A084JF77_9CLOT|nr:hypothetical protein IO99_04915 [Clostridium sulfidigenes]
MTTKHYNIKMKKQHKGKSKIYLLCFDLSFYFNCLRWFNTSNISGLGNEEHKNIKIQKQKKHKKFGMLELL